MYLRLAPVTIIAYYAVAAHQYKHKTRKAIKHNDTVAVSAVER